MSANATRRWLRVAAAVAVVAGVVGFVAFRGGPKDVPRLVVFGERQLNGQDAVIFQFDAPKHRAAVLGTVRTHSPSTGGEREAVCDAVPGQLVEAGESTLLTVIIPTDHVWRVRCGIWSVDRGLKNAMTRLKLCWRTKSLHPLALPSRWVIAPSPDGIVESELITNSVPSTADPPRP